MTLEQLEFAVLVITCGGTAVVFAVGLVADTISRRKIEKQNATMWAARAERAAERLS